MTQAYSCQYRHHEDFLRIWSAACVNGPGSLFSWESWQRPTGEKDGFKPGDGVNANIGVRYTGHAGFTPHLQLNLRAEGRESGVNADVDNSGATLVYLSPGVTFNVSPKFQVYAFAQLPVAQRVTGLQIEPRWSASVGMHWTF